jgi:hypothetical protein
MIKGCKLNYSGSVIAAKQPIFHVTGNIAKLPVVLCTCVNGIIIFVQNSVSCFVRCV